MSSTDSASPTGFALTIRNGTIAALGGMFVGDIGIADGRVAALGRNLAPGREDIDATGLVVTPGAIDPHTHFARNSLRSGKISADDYESGTRCAALGGVTTVLNCAFQEAGESIDRVVERELDLADKSHIDYGFHLAVTDLSAPHIFEGIAKLVDKGIPSVKVFTSLPPYASGKSDILQVLRVAAEAGLVVNAHVEDHALCSHLTDNLLSRGCGNVRHFASARPNSAEALAVREMAAYARATGATLYLHYLSSAAGVAEAAAARNDGGRIYVETRPLYLFLDESSYNLAGSEANRYVCLPPLRSIEDQQYLWRALSNGDVQTYATDHVAWTNQQKGLEGQNFNEIPAGVSNIQTGVGMLYAEGVVKGRLTLARFVELIATNPAKIFGLWPRKGAIAVGADADVMLLDPEKRFSLTRASLASNADFDLFDGSTFVGWPVATIARGEIIARDNTMLSVPGRGRFVQREFPVLL